MVHQGGSNLHRTAEPEDNQRLVNQSTVADQWKQSLAEHWPALLVLSFGIGLRIWWFQGIGLNDDTEYADSAYRLASGFGIHQYALGSIDSIRFGMVLPVPRSTGLMGVSNVTSGIFPLFCSSLTMWLTYLLGRALFSQATGAARPHPAGHLSARHRLLDPAGSDGSGGELLGDLAAPAGDGRPGAPA